MSLCGSTVAATITRQVALSNSSRSVATRPPFSWWGRCGLWRGTRWSDSPRAPLRFLYSHSDLEGWQRDRKSTRLNSSHANISYAVFCLKKKKYHLAEACYKRHKHTPPLFFVVVSGDPLKLHAASAEP